MNAMYRAPFVLSSVFVSIFALAACALAQQPGVRFTPPEDVAFRTANISSEGTRMAAEVFAPKSPASAKLPTIVMAHGWGGVAANLRPDAARFASRLSCRHVRLSWL